MRPRLQAGIRVNITVIGIIECCQIKIYLLFCVK
jgi:hypothetical protein